MKQRLLKVYAMRVDGDRVYKGHVESMPDTLKAMQEFVGGHIQDISLTKEIVLILNEEGKITGLPVNRAWLFEDGRVADILVGNVFACRFGEDGDFKDILEEDIHTISKLLPAVRGIKGKVIRCIREWRLPDYVEKPNV